MFLAALAGCREALKDLNLMRRFLTVPAVTMKVMTAIHWEALAAVAQGDPLPQPAPGAPAPRSPSFRAGKLD